MSAKRFWCCAVAILAVVGSGASALAGGDETTEEPVTMPAPEEHAEEAYDTLTVVMAALPDEDYAVE